MTVMKIKLREFTTELEHWRITPEYRNGRVVLTGGRDDAREYYTAMLRKSPEFEGALIWELAQTNPDVMDAVEERRAIIWIECEDDSVRSAIMCNIPH